MTTNTTIQIEQVLSDLNRVRQSEFRRTLIRLAGRQLRGDTVSASGWNAGVEALERSVVDSVAEAAPKLLDISKSTVAFALLDRASIALLLKLAEMLREWHQQRVALPITPSNETWLPAIRNNLERQLDNYRANFKDALAAEPEEQAQVGRKPKDWLPAIHYVWGQLYRAELEPDNQATLERAIMDYFERLNLRAGESTVRDHARDMFKELKRKA